MNDKIFALIIIIVTVIFVVSTSALYIKTIKKIKSYNTDPKDIKNESSDGKREG